MAKQNLKGKQGKEKSEINLVRTENSVSSRGQIFQGAVIRKFPKRITIQFERTVYVPKYERFLKKSTRIHARLPDNMDVSIGDLVKVQECRPLSKIIHFILVEKVKSAEGVKQ